MAGMSTGRRKSFERWSATGFVVAGVAWFGDTFLLGLEIFRLYPSGVINSGLVLIGLMCSVLGLIGLYPRLADRAPRPALASTVVVAVGGAVIVVQTVWGIAAIGIPVISNPPDINTLMLGILVIAGFVSFGITILYTGVPSYLVGVLLLAYVAAFVGAVVSTEWLQLGFVGVLSGIALAIAYLVHTRAAPSH